MNSPEQKFGKQYRFENRISTAIASIGPAIEMIFHFAEYHATLGGIYKSKS
jgi:hypothetical protein